MRRIRLAFALATLGLLGLAAAAAEAAITVANQSDSGPGSLRQAIVEAPVGTLTLGGKGLKTQTATITGQAEVKLKVLGKGAVRKALRKRGKRKVQINVTYAPTGNAAATATRKAKLVRKHKKQRSKRSRR